MVQSFYIIYKMSVSISTSLACPLVGYKYTNKSITDSTTKNIIL